MSERGWRGALAHFKGKFNGGRFTHMAVKGANWKETGHLTLHSGDETQVAHGWHTASIEERGLDSGSNYEIHETYPVLVSRVLPALPAIFNSCMNSNSTLSLRLSSALAVKTYASPRPGTHMQNNLFRRSDS